MSNDREIQEFLKQWVGKTPVRKRKPAAEIMKAPPSHRGPRLEARQGGGQRWVVQLQSRPDWKRIVRRQPIWHLGS